MSKEKSPAFQFYPRDLLSDINWIMMSYTERGLYWHLVSICWLEGSLPADEGALARIACLNINDFNDLWKSISKCFKAKEITLEQGGSKGGCVLVHPRLEIERAKQAIWREKSALGGRRSAHKRKHKRNLTHEQGGTVLVPTKRQPKVNSSSSSSTSVTNVFSDLKTNQKKLLEKSERPKDETYEIWAAAFLGAREVPYRNTKADFVQLASLRKAYGLNGRGSPEHWSRAIENYLASPLPKFTLADLCSRYDVFVHGRVNEYNRPDRSLTRTDFLRLEQEIENETR